MLKPKVVNYINYKYFNQSTFLEEIESTDFLIHSDYQRKRYSHLTEISLKVVNKYVPLKKKVVGGNQAPFLDKEIMKSINTKAG